MRKTTSPDFQSHNNLGSGKQAQLSSSPFHVNSAYSHKLGACRTTIWCYVVVPALLSMYISLRSNQLMFTDSASSYRHIRDNLLSLIKLEKFSLRCLANICGFLHTTNAKQGRKDDPLVLSDQSEQMYSNKNSMVPLIPSKRFWCHPLLRSHVKQESLKFWIICPVTGNHRVLL